MKGLLLYGMIVLVVSAAFGRVIGPPTEQELHALNMRVYQLAILADDLYGMPMERRPALMFEYVPEQYDAWADCGKWRIYIQPELVRRKFQYVHDSLMAHEYAHLVHCYIEGGPGEDPHDILWGTISESLGGPRQY